MMLSVDDLNNIELLKAQNKKLKEQNRNLQEDNNKLQQLYQNEHCTLLEIKEIAENWRNNDWSCYLCRKNMDEKLDEILQKIAESKVNE